MKRIEKIIINSLQYTEELYKVNIPNTLDVALGPNADTTPRYPILTFLRKSELFDLI